ncbi:MAG TPA: MFS transporter [Acidimicrobiales bacterium]|nr:MFS transporter [Acidimicrobiales bacterium]
MPSSFESFVEGLKDARRQLRQSAKNAPTTARKVVREPRSVVKGAGLAPLLVLYGHTLVDSIDRGGFNTILPEIRDQFGMTTEQITSVAAIAIFVSLLLGVPTAYWSDRGKRRTWWLASGAAMASVFSVLTGTAATAAAFVVARAGFGLGIRLNDPVQGSLLSDYYAVDTRPTTFAGRQGMDNLGQLIGPLFFGVTAAVFGWRVAVLSIAVPAALLFIYSIRLHEPVRGAPEREAMGATAADAFADEEPARFWESIRILNRIKTVRRIYFAVPCFIGGILGISVLMPLFQEEVFGLSSAQRGMFGSFTNVAGIFGLFVGVPITSRYLVSGKPEGVLDLLGAGGIVATVALAGMAFSPNIWIMAAFGLVLFFIASLFLPSIGVVIAMTVPARVRGMGFAMMAFWALPGLVMLPVAGAVGEAFGLRWGMVVGLPLLTTGAFIIAGGKADLRRDIEAAFASAMAALESPEAPAVDLVEEEATAVVDSDPGDAEPAAAVDAVSPPPPADGVRHEGYARER